MRLFIFSPLYPPHIGGLESHSAEFNLHMSEQGNDITVFTPRLPDTALEVEKVADRLRIIRYPAWEPIHNYPLPKYWPFWWSLRFFQLLRDVWRERPDIVISRTRFFASSLLARCYAKVRRIPHIHIEHGSDFVHFRSSVKTALGKFYDHTFGRLVLRGADIIVANSEASARFVKLLSGKDATVIYRGYETDNIIKAQSPQELRQSYLGKVIVGYLGRLIDGKGVADLIRAISILNRTDVACFIIGDGPERKHLESLTHDLRLSECVHFFGHQPLPQALAIMQTFDIFVNPSYGEGMPTSVVEAALSKKSIIATDVGGTREIISGIDDGFLVSPKKPEMIADKIRTLIENAELRRSLGEAAYAKVYNRFSWDSATNQYLELFNKLLEPKSRS